jgi:hypothetical protein
MLKVCNPPGSRQWSRDRPAVSVQALRARWAGIRSAHLQLFDGLSADDFCRPAFGAGLKASLI